ncbi:hypothetical protein [Halorussus aquaticus]|uniref:Uncharacterized protein n=1 Tax=Halorussus aquaticus TaxID=2953748 RepID=A0ABD5Q4N0_9EURY|nr:hypothetical protein [Halorussus aquaticus]
MTSGQEGMAAVEQLEEALRADDGDVKNFHIREAIQLLHIADKAVAVDPDSANEMAE